MGSLSLRVVVCAVVTVAATVVAGCASSADATRYDLTGQVIEVDTERLAITVSHDEIPGYMIGMTMPFPVRNRADLDGLAAGDLIRAELVIERDAGYLESIERTRSAPLPAAARQPAAFAVESVLEGDPLPDVAYVDETGQARRLGDEPGRALVMTFIYTRCPFPTFCPLMDRHFTRIQDAVQSSDQLRGQVRLLSVTIDPVFDMPPVLQAHARELGADPSVWQFARPDEESAGSLAARFGVITDPDASDPATIVHSLVTVIVDRDQRIARILHGNEWTPPDVILALETMLGDRGPEMRP